MSKFEILKKELKKVDYLGFDYVMQAVHAVRTNDDFAVRWDLLNDPKCLKAAMDYRAEKGL